MPDLRITTLANPTNGLTDNRVTLSWTVANNGLAAASGTWVDGIYISTDEQLGNDTFVSSSMFSGNLNVGESYTRTQQVYLPSAPGRYWIIAYTDVTNAIAEGSERNNVSVSAIPVTVEPSYRATAQVDVDVVPNGTAIPIRGHAYNTTDNSPAAYRLLTVRVRVKGIRRTFNALADGNGDFTVTFQPLPTEAGLYTVCADHPLVTEDTAQDQFTILGMKANPDVVNVRLVPNETVSGQISIGNLGGVPITGISAVAQYAPAQLGVQLEVTNTLAGDGTIQLAYTLNAAITNRATFQFRIHLASAEGVILDVPVNVSVVPLQAQLVANPSFLARSMVRGTQTILSFEVSNVGGAPSGPLNVMLPPLTWMSLASASNLPSMNPGDKITVTLALNPPEDLALIRYDGNLGVIGNGAGVVVPFQFRATSTAVGDLKVVVQDEYTFFVAEEPNVTNATVRVRDGITGDLIVEGNTTNVGTILFENIAEGSYSLEVLADRHGPYRGVVTIVPGVTNEATTFLTRQTVSYRWTVVPVEIQDTYKIVLESVFETEVPIPNVVVENPFIMPMVVVGLETQFEIKIRNEGLIAANGVQVTVPEDPNYIITPLVREIGVLPAKSAMSIPVTIRHRSHTVAGGNPGDERGGQRSQITRGGRRRV